MNSDPVLLHIHIPKTGGTTMRDILYRIYDNGNDAPEEECGCLANGIYWYPIGFEEDSYTVPRDDVLAALGRRDDFRLVSGHFPFGIHEVISRQCHYMTVLREPVARVISLYHHVRHFDYNIEVIHERVVSENISLDDFVAKIGYQPVDNGQVRLLSGQNPEFGGCTEDMLQNAKDNLSKHFAIFGILERFEESLEVMANRLGWDDGQLNYETKNANPLREQEITAKSYALIRDYNQFDIELYQFAEGLLSEISAGRA